MTLIHHPRMSHPFQGEGNPLRPHWEGAYQSVTSTKERGSQGEGGTVISHPFQEGVVGRDESPNRGGGTMMSHLKGACPKGGPSNHNQEEGVGADYVNLPAKWVLYYFNDIFTLKVKI